MPRRPKKKGANASASDAGQSQNTAISADTNGKQDCSIADCQAELVSTAPRSNASRKTHWITHPDFPARPPTQASRAASSSHAPWAELTSSATASLPIPLEERMAEESVAILARDLQHKFDNEEPRRSEPTQGDDTQTATDAGFTVVSRKKGLKSKGN